MDTFQTSLHPEYSLTLNIEKCTLQITHIPIGVQYSAIYIMIRNIRGDVVKCKKLSISSSEASNGQIPSVSLRELTSGKFSIDVLALFGDKLHSFFANILPELSKKGVHCKFLPSPMNAVNEKFMRNLAKDEARLRELLLPSCKCQSESAEIADCARSLVSSSASPEEKMLAVHDFIVSNIAYDFDGLESKEYIHYYKNNCALATLVRMKGICQGITNLSVSLLRNMGIPAVQVVCYSIGGDKEGGWAIRANHKAHTGNHVLTAAYYNDSWHLMDCTWDGNLVIREGERKAIRDMEYRYFDVSPQMLALTHKIIKLE